MINNRFQQIYIEDAVKDSPVVKRILSRIETDHPLQYISDLFSLIKELPPVYHPANRSKTLFLGKIRGTILKTCPGSHGHLCCNYHVINLYLGCPLDCSYCILQSYLNQPFTIINVDIENIFSQLTHINQQYPGKIYRIGTGEVGDSLVYDHLTDFSLDFVEYFGKHQDFIFEFKTKTNNVDNLLKLRSPGNIVIGFSVNPQDVIDHEEKLAATLKKRISAAARLVEKGYKIALHFDPLINISDFYRQYQLVIQEIFSKIQPQDIGWISLGTFRYPSELKNMIQYNYPESQILAGEFIECADKKFRYFKPIRLALYQQMIAMLHQVDPDFLIYLCMESPSVWQKTLGYLPYEEEKMDLIFQKALHKN